MRQITSGLCAAAATVLVLAATASASSVHLEGGENAEPAFSDNGLTLTAGGPVSRTQS